MTLRLHKPHDKPILQWVTGAGDVVETAFLLGSDSPESRLRECDKHQLDVLASCGINTLTATTFGGDAKDVHPFRDRKNPGAGYNTDTLARWRDYLTHWHLLGPQQVACLMLSEFENHKELPLPQRRHFWKEMVDEFYALNIVWFFEEIPIGPGESIKPDEWEDELRYLREIAPDHHLIGLHNPTDPRHNDPWQWYVGKGLVDIAMIQCPLADAPAWTAKQRERGYAVIASEVSNPYGFGPNDGAKFQQWCETPGLSGALAFLGNVDQSAVDHEQYRGLYEAVTKPTLADVRKVTPLHWKAAPWTTGTVDEGLAMHVEPNEMASVETRYFVLWAHDWIDFRTTVDGASVEVRARVINEANDAMQASAVCSVGERTLAVPHLGSFTRRLCLDALNFLPNAAPARVTLREVL